MAGAAVPKDKKLGGIANTIIGLLGGGAGDYILRALGLISTAAATGAATGAAGTGLDVSTILANIGISGVSGAALTAIITYIRDALQKK